MATIKGLLKRSPDTPEAPGVHPQALWSFRPRSDREAGDAIVSNLLLHWFPSKVYKPSLDWSYSFWLGTASATLFLLLVVLNDSFLSQPKVAAQVLEQFQDFSWGKGVDTFVSPLTPRETEILNYMAKGMLNKQIASNLDISEQTIKNHVTSILRKLNANARTEAVIVAIKQGLITIS